MGLCSHLATVRGTSLVMKSPGGRGPLGPAFQVDLESGCAWKNESPAREERRPVEAGEDKDVDSPLGPPEKEA